MGHLTLCDRLEQYFKARPGVWIDGRELATVAGAYAWRTRVSDLRKRKMRIENRKVRWSSQLTADFVTSEYRYLPADLLAVAEEH